MKVPDNGLGALEKLGGFLRAFVAGDLSGPHNQGAFDEAREVIRQAHLQNAWFTPEEVEHALGQWGKLLTRESLESWMAAYPAGGGKACTVALILAGNVPLVGFHDLVCVLLTGHRALVKCASSDAILLPFLVRKLEAFDPDQAGRVQFTTGRLEGFDAVIATGSNNTSRYFEFYFGGYPHIIRKNRNSVAVLTGKESPEQLEGLAEDIFRYFGMGCRSVSKIYVPEGFDFDPFFQACYGHKWRIDHQKYANNYDYNKAVYLMSGAEMLDNGFLLLKEDPGLGSPIGTLFFETYPDPGGIRQRLQSLEAELQCVVGPEDLDGSIPFGTSQKPGLDTYADQVDTVAFLLEIAAAQPAG